MDYQQLIVDINVSILHTLEQMDKCNRKLLLVFSKVKYKEKAQSLYSDQLYCSESPFYKLEFLDEKK